MVVEMIEAYIEVINLVIALVMVLIGIRTIRRLDGELKTASKFLITSIFLFGIHELIGVLEEFKILIVEDLYFITELLFIIAFFGAIIYFKRLFDGLSAKKGGKK